MDKIFVQIPAYRDKELPRTIYELNRKAYNRKALRICIIWQHDISEHLPADIFRYGNVEIIDVPHGLSKGANWARSVVQRKWNEEKFTLLIDSHIRFVLHWDRKLIETFHELKGNGIQKPIITTYLPAYDPATDPRGRVREILRIYPLEREYGILTKFTGQRVPFRKSLKKPMPADYISLAFLFTEGRFNQEIRFDPEIYFFGDEITTGLRAYTNGYDFFHPHYIIGWHAYDRSTRITHWDSHTNWTELQRKSLEKIRSVLSGKAKSFGVGSKRSIRDYEDHILTKLIE